MHDSLLFLSAISLAAGSVALVATFASVLVAGWLSIQNRPLNRVAHITFSLTQLALLAQMMTAVWLLALDVTQWQSLVYYLAGFTAVAGFMLFYWWPVPQMDADGLARNTRRAMVTAVVAFLLAVTGLTVGTEAAYAATPTPPTAVVLLPQTQTVAQAIATDKPAPMVLCLGCDTAVGNQFTEIQRLDQYNQIELVHFTTLAPIQPRFFQFATSDEMSFRPNQPREPIYNLIAFMRLSLSQ